MRLRLWCLSTVKFKDAEGSSNSRAGRRKAQKTTKEPLTVLPHWTRERGLSPGSFHRVRRSVLLCKSLRFFLPSVVRVAGGQEGVPRCDTRRHCRFYDPGLKGAWFLCDCGFPRLEVATGGASKL